MTDAAKGLGESHPGSIFQKGCQRARHLLAIFQDARGIVAFVAKREQLTRHGFRRTSHP
jgi:hypothetical protein